jgi:anti-sigma factor NepR-like protein
MAADTPLDGPASGSAHNKAGSNSPFDGSLTPAQLTAEIGRCLRPMYQASLTEPLPQELEALVRQLQEREQGAVPGRTQ